MCFITSPITPLIINLELGLTSRMGFLWWESVKSYYHGMDKWMGYNIIDVKVTCRLYNYSKT